jgi:hypothetical protein
LDKDIIERAKKYAASRKMSLSRIIEAYLSTITAKDKSEIEISPFVCSLSSDLNVPAELDARDAHRNYNEQKHL